MGIYAALAELVIQEKRRYHQRDRALALGVNHFNYNGVELEAIFKNVGVAPENSSERILNTRLRVPWMKADALDARTLFRWLGFAGVDEVDFHADEQPTLLHDLNCPVPAEWRGRYDLVFDGGTTEHLFDVRTVLFNIVDLLRVGGTVIHSVPLSGWIDHGYFQFSPSLLWDFYTASQFSNLKAFVIQVDRVAGLPMRVWEIGRPQEEPLLFNDFHCKTLLVFFAQKTIESVARVPVQGSYLTATLNPYASRIRGKEVHFLARSEPRLRVVIGDSVPLFQFMSACLPRTIFSRVQALLLERIFYVRRICSRCKLGK